MDVTAEMAGTMAAHAVWCVSDGSILVPILALQKPDGNREMHRLVTDDYGEGVDRGREWLERNPEGAISGVLVYDGFVTSPAGKTDALLIEARLYVPEEQSFSMIIPYRNAEDSAGFAVHRLKFTSLKGNDEDPATIVEAFFRGVGLHQKAADVWSAHLDESR